MKWIFGKIYYHMAAVNIIGINSVTLQGEKMKSASRKRNDHPIKIYKDQRLNLVTRNENTFNKLHK